MRQGCRPRPSAHGESCPTAPFDTPPSAALRERWDVSKPTALFDPFPQVVLHLVDRYPVLRHLVALADGDRVLLVGFPLAHRVEIHRDTKRCSNLILTAVALAHGLGLVV